MFTFRYFYKFPNEYSINSMIYKLKKYRQVIVYGIRNNPSYKIVVAEGFSVQL